MINKTVDNNSLARHRTVRGGKHVINKTVEKNCLARHRTVIQRGNPAMNKTVEIGSLA